MSGGVLRRRVGPATAGSLVSFYALDVGRGFATAGSSSPITRTPRGVSFYALDVGRGFATGRRTPSTVSSALGFYALDVGRGFATDFPWVRCTRVWGSGFYALDVGRGFATRHERQARPVHLHRFL